VKTLLHPSLSFFHKQLQEQSSAQKLGHQEVAQETPLLSNLFSEALAQHKNSLLIANAQGCA